MMFVDCSAMSFCKKIVCFLTPRQVLRKGLLGLFLAGFALLAGSVWAEAINTESATAKYVAPFEMAASQAAASPRQVERAVKATLTDDQRIAAEVAALLARNPLFTDVRPLVNGSVVQLEGSVRNAEAKELATKLAESVKGVVAVDNALIVSADFRSQLGEVIRKVRDRLVQLITSIPMFLLAIMVLVLFNWIGRGLAAHPGLLGFRPHYGNTYFQSLIRRGIRIAFIAVGFLVALDLLDSTALVGALLGSVSIIGVTLGFAFRGVAENYIAGVLLSLRSPFEPGDHVVIGTHEGIRMVRAELKKAGIDIPAPTYRLQLMESASLTETGKPVSPRTRPVTPQAPVDKTTEIDEQIAEIRSRQKPEEDLLTPREEHLEEAEPTQPPAQKTK